MASAKYPIPAKGFITWLYARDGQGRSRYETVALDTAIVRSRDEIVLEFEYESRRYTLVLKRTTTERFEGGDLQDTFRASCDVYRNEGGLALIGNSWVEDTYECTWFAELRNERDI